MANIKESIVLIPHSNETQFLNMLSLHGKKSFGTRVFDSLELAQYALLKNGIVLDKKFVTDASMAAFLYKKIKEIPYFNEYSYLDVINFVKSLNKLRRAIVEDEEVLITSMLPMENFPNKNNAIIIAYDMYMNILEENAFIDEIQIIREAIENNCYISDVDFIKYDEFIFENLDEKLLNIVSNGIVSKEKLGNESGATIKSYTRAFGEVNEVENIISYIIDNKIPFDQCLIAVTDTASYSKLFENLSQTLNVPIVLGTNFTILETNPGKMVCLLKELAEKLYNGEYFKAIIFSDIFDIEKFKNDAGIPHNFDTVNEKIKNYKEKISFDKIVEMAGNLSLSFDNNKNNQKIDNYEKLLEKYSYKNGDEDIAEREIFSYVKAIANILNKGIANFISNYCLLNNYSRAKDQDALTYITQQLKFFEHFNIPFDEIINVIKSANVGSESAKPGAIFVTTINKALLNIRKYVFIAGLSSNYFPGTVKEDPVILDEDYAAFGVLSASRKMIDDNKQAYHSLINIANKFGCEVHLSFAYYNSQTLKTQNSSSVVFETYLKQFGKEKNLKDFDNSFKNKAEGVDFVDVEYFEKPFSLSSVVGRNYANPTKINIKNPVEEVKITTSSLKTRAYSASAIETFNNCHYQFFLAYILGLPQEKETDVFEVIPANDFGTLAHSLLESLDKKTTSKEDLLKKSAEIFDEYRIKHPTDNDFGFEKEKKEFITMMDNAYEMEDDNQTALKEVNIECLHEDSGIRIHGFPDKVVKLSDDGGKTHYHVIDYKTGRKFKHFESDPSTLLQATIYSYILQKNVENCVVDSFEYKYLRLKGSVLCKNIDSCFLKLDTVLKDMRKCFDAKEFPCASDKEACKYCCFKSICSKGVK